MTQLERLIGACAALLALFGLAALDPRSDSPVAMVSLILLGFHGLGTAAFVGHRRLRVLWTERGRTVRHTTDGLLILVLLATTGGASSYFFTYMLYPVLAGALRWGVRGAYWTAVASLAGYACFVVAALLSPAVSLAPRHLGVRLLTLTIAAGLLGYVTTRLRFLPAELRDDEAALSLLLDGLADGVLVVDDKGIVRSVNQPAAQMFGTTSEALQGLEVQRLANIVDPRSGTSGMSALANGGPRHRVVWEVEALRGDGTTFPCELTVSALRLGTQRVYVGVLRDISHRKEAEAAARVALEAEVAEEERVRLVQDLHDGLLQTLTGAALQLRTVESLMPKDPPGALRRLVQARHALATEQRELRFWASEVKPTLVESDGAGLMERLTATLERIQATWSVSTELRFAVPDPLPPALGQQVYRLVQESVVNAVRHGQASRVELDVSGSEDAVTIRVRDDGRGFPFEGFRSHEELEAQRLGPVLLMHRIRRVNGSLAIESAPSGARLEIVVPLGGQS